MEVCLFGLVALRAAENNSKGQLAGGVFRLCHCRHAPTSHYPFIQTAKRLVLDMSYGRHPSRVWNEGSQKYSFLVCLTEPVNELKPRHKVAVPAQV